MSQSTSSQQILNALANILEERKICRDRRQLALKNRGVTMHPKFERRSGGDRRK